MKKNIILAIFTILIFVGCAGSETINDNPIYDERVIHLPPERSPTPTPTPMLTPAPTPTEPPIPFYDESVELAVTDYLRWNFDEPLTNAEKLEIMQNMSHLIIWVYWTDFTTLADLPRYMPNLQTVYMLIRWYKTKCADLFLYLAELDNLVGVSMFLSGLTQDALDFFHSLDLEYLNIEYAMVFEGATVELERAPLEMLSLHGADFARGEICGGEIFGYIRIIQNNKAYELLEAGLSEYPYFHWFAEGGHPTALLVSQLHDSTPHHIYTLDIPGRTSTASGLIIKDVNDDGMDDIVVQLGRVGQFRNIPYYTTFIYQNGRYIYAPDYATITP
ncbi:MAG: hypothetical protein FWB80_00325 [Defluviitaleaceae bacterium]|nr:hypothetical protein [Defluviitaleaceae bacterium]